MKRGREESYMGSQIKRPATSRGESSSGPPQPSGGSQRLATDDALAYPKAVKKITLSLEEEPAPKKQPVEFDQEVDFDQAIYYVSKIKARFQYNEQPYKDFLEILNISWKVNKSKNEVHDKVALLFEDHQDLHLEFTYFLTDSSGSTHVSHAPTSARAASVPAVRRDERSSGLASRHSHVEKREKTVSSQADHDRSAERLNAKVYYPARDDPESAEICYSDMKCLASSSYLSSPIMDFYIRYLKSPESIIPSKQCTDYHFFNTYFYSKLNRVLQNHRGQQDGVSLAELRRWFKGVNIFEKAYIFVPICDRLHWSLAVICIPAREDKSGPIILHLDSLGLHPSNIIFQNIRSFLKAEWEYLNQAGVPNHIPIEESIWKTWISKIETKKIEVPHQENNYDCGLFVLYFMERFIKDAPPRLIMSDLDMFGKKWFRPAVASSLRNTIKTYLEKRFEMRRTS